MEYYMAPFEGITGYIYRNAHSSYFGKFDKYFTPFLSPHGEKEQLTHKERNDVAPQNNEGLNVVPQILTNKAGEFIRVASYLRELGYEEVNLNLGCPSGTVVSKYKGAGFLAKREELTRFLEEIFAKTDMRISIKTRIGVEDVAEFEELLDIFERFPLEELIIHPRLRTEYYNGTPHRECFQHALACSGQRLCYNGDLFLKRQVESLAEEVPGTDCMMLGRGVLRNPGLLDYIRTGQMPRVELVKEFHDRLYSDYKQLMPGGKPALYKLKELWFYMGSLFTNWDSRYAKQIRKCNRLEEYEQIVKVLFAREQYVDIL